MTFGHLGQMMQDYDSDNDQKNWGKIFFPKIFLVWYGYVYIGLTKIFNFFFVMCKKRYSNFVIKKQILNLIWKAKHIIIRNFLRRKSLTSDS